MIDYVIDMNPAQDYFIYQQSPFGLGQMQKGTQVLMYGEVVYAMKYSTGVFKFLPPFEEHEFEYYKVKIDGFS